MTETDTTIVVRPGRESDDVTVLELLDGATTWLIAQGRTGQWGTDLPSTDIRRVAQAASWARGDGLYLAWNDDVPAGALVVGDAPAYVPPKTGPELYINLLVTNRACAGRGVGRLLLAHAAKLARERGVDLLRVDCYAGDDGALVRYYEKAGFAAAEPFAVELSRGSWPGQILEQRLSASTRGQSSHED